MDREANKGKSGGEKGEFINVFEKQRNRPWHRKASSDSDSSIEIKLYKF